MRIEIITWDDASVDAVTVSPEEAAKMQGVRTHTVGWVVGENQHGVTLCTDTYDCDKSGHTPMFIPLGMIAKRVKLPIPQKKNPKSKAARKKKPIKPITLVEHNDD